MNIMTEEEFRSYVKTIDNCFFIEVGANDGVVNDPIYDLVKEYKWNGILIEPHKGVFGELQNNYKENEGLIFENCIIAKNDGITDFYYNGDYTTQHNSLSYKYAKENFGEHFRIVKTPSMTFNTLLKKHNVKKIDLLLIDVEGYDFDLLKTFPFDLIKPGMIRSEFIHIGNENYTLSDIENFISDKGYDCFILGTDIIGIKK